MKKDGGRMYQNPKEIRSLNWHVWVILFYAIYIYLGKEPENHFVGIKLCRVTYQADCWVGVIMYTVTSRHYHAAVTAFNWYGFCFFLLINTVNFEESSCANVWSNLQWQWFR